MITIPTYEEARTRVLSGKYSHLDWFVVENEPGGIGEEKFRMELANVIDDVVKECHENGRGVVIRVDTDDEEFTPEDQRCDDMVTAVIMAVVLMASVVLLAGAFGWITK